MTQAIPALPLSRCDFCAYQVGPTHEVQEDHCDRGQWVGNDLPPAQKDPWANCHLYKPMTCPMLHDLKIWPEHFNAIKAGDKTFEVRKDDRGFRVGEYLLLREWAPDTKAYTGRILVRRISLVHRGLGMVGSYVVLALAK